MPTFEVTMKPLSLTKACAKVGGKEHRAVVVCADKHEAVRLARYNVSLNQQAGYAITEIREFAP